MRSQRECCREKQLDFSINQLMKNLLRQLIKGKRHRSTQANSAPVAPTTFAVGESTSCKPFPSEMDRFRRVFVIL